MTHRVAELYFDSIESLQAAMASAGGQATVAHAMEISTGGPRLWSGLQKTTSLFESEQPEKICTRFVPGFAYQQLEPGAGVRKGLSRMRRGSVAGGQPANAEARAGAESQSVAWIIRAGRQCRQGSS
jgi:hypothetical protein